MAWDFSTEPEFEKKLDWIREFVREEVEPLEVLFPGCEFLPLNDERRKIVDPLKQQVREQGLWAPHLGPELGGQGFGAVKLTLINEILGRSPWAPIVFGTQAPDTGNAEIIARFGTQDQKDRYLAGLLSGEIFSCFSMTEPQGGADPKVFTTRAERQGVSWVINGEKWFASHARYAAFYIVMAVTDPAAKPYHRMSMFIVPADTPGIEIVRNVGFLAEKQQVHAYLRFTGVRVPLDHMLGEPGQAFVVAQTRLGGGRLHHAMRTIGQARRMLDHLCERAVSRETQGEKLSQKQMIQEKIADSWIELEQFRLLVLRTAWLCDKHKDYNKVRKDISAVKVAMPKVLHDIAARALQVHGSLGLSDEMPFADQVLQSFHMGLADGPVEVHKVTVARQLLRDYQPANTLFPSYHLLAARERAMEKYGAELEPFDHDA